MPAPDTLCSRAAPLISAADEEHIHPFILLRFGFCQLCVGESWVLVSELLRASKLDRPEVQVLPVLLAPPLGGHMCSWGLGVRPAILTTKRREVCLLRVTPSIGTNARWMSWRAG